MGSLHSKQRGRCSSRSSSPTSSDVEEVVAQVGITGLGRTKGTSEVGAGSSSLIRDSKRGEVEPQLELTKGTITLHGGMPLGTDDGKYTSPVLLLKMGTDGLQHHGEEEMAHTVPQPGCCGCKAKQQPGARGSMQFTQDVYKLEQDIIAIPVQDVLSITAHAKVFAQHTTCRSVVEEKRRRCCRCCCKPKVKEPQGPAPSAYRTMSLEKKRRRSRRCCACCKPEVIEHVETADHETASRHVVVTVEALGYSHVDTVSQPDCRLKQLMKSRALQVVEYTVALLSSTDTHDDATFTHEVDSASKLCVLITQLKSSAAAAENRWPSTAEVSQLLSEAGLHKFGAKELREQRV